MHRLLRGLRLKPKPYGGTRPVIMNAGMSATGRAYAFRNTDAYFTATRYPSLEVAAREVAEIKAQSRAFGREIGVYTSPGKDAGLDREKYWKAGKPMPIAAAYGIDPLLFLVAATSLPKTECEYDYYSGIAGFYTPTGYGTELATGK